MKTYLIIYSWDYKYSEWDEREKEHDSLLRRTYGIKFPSEMILKTELKGEELYKFIHKSLRDFESRGSENISQKLTFSILNVILLD